MGVVALKVELKKFGLSVRGKKKELFDRLKNAIETGASLVDETNEAAAGDGFSPGAYWEESKQDGDEIFECFLEGFRAPTVPQGEVPTTIKRNYKAKFDRMAFTGITDVPKRTKKGNFVTSKGEYVYEKKVQVKSQVKIEWAKKRNWTSTQVQYIGLKGSSLSRAKNLFIRCITH